MKEETFFLDVKKTLFIALLMATLTACKSGGSSSSDATAPEPNPIEQALQSTFQTGDSYGIPSAESVIQKVDHVIETGHGQFNPIIYQWH